MTTFLNIKEFFVQGGVQKKSHVLLHITEPQSLEEKEKGYFFALLELKGADAEIVEQLQDIITTIEEGIYETEDSADATALEATLEFVNRRSRHILANKKISLSFLVGLAKDNTISFAYHGHPSAIVVYRKKDDSYDYIPLIAEADKGSDQLFSAVLEGKLTSRDMFVVTTPHTRRYITEDDILQHIVSHGSSQAIKKVEQELAAKRDGNSYGGLLIQFSKQPAVIAKKQKREKTKDANESIDSLLGTQDKTGNIIYPSLVGSLRKILSSSVKNIKKTNKKSKSSKKSVETNYRPRQEKTFEDEEETTVGKILIVLGKTITTVGYVLASVATHILFFLKQIIVGSFYLITNNRQKRKIVIADMKASIGRKQAYLKSLPVMSRILLFAVIFFTILFLGSIWFVKAKEAKEARIAADIQQVQTIEDKLDAAEATTIYGDANKALILVKEAERLVQELPTDSDKKIEQKQMFETQIQQIFNDARKLTTVETEQLISLSEISQTIKHLELIDDTLIAYSDIDNNHITIDVITKKVETIDHAAISPLVSATTPKEEDTTIFISGDQNIAGLNKEGFTVSSKTIDFPVQNADISSAFVYNRRLYTVDTANNQIYKHNPTQTGYGKGTQWLNNDVDLSKAVDIAIDGDVLILGSDGKILKFESGNAKPFSIKGVDPELNEPTAFWTYNDIDYIAILEPTNKRLILLNKDGSLIDQITDMRWEAPTGLAIDADEDIAYVLDKGVIYKVDIGE